MALIRTARYLAMAAVLVAMTPAPARAQAAAVDPYYEFLNARHLEGEGDNDGALAALQRAAAADPKSAEIRAEIASFYLRRQKRADAEKSAREALALDADNVEANRVLGSILAAGVGAPNTTPQNQAALIREAIPYLEKAAAGSTGVVDPNLNYNLGGLYLQSNQPEKAQQALARVVAQNPGSVQARLRMAQAQEASKDLKGAIATLDEIVDDEPRVAGPLADYQREAGMLREAVDNYTRALAARPTDKRLKRDRILSLYELGDFTRAATLAAEGQKQHPDDPLFPRLQASALFAGGETPKAIEVLEGVVRQFPKDVASQLSLAEMYGRSKRYPEQEKTLRQVLTIEPNNDDAMNSLGYMLAITNDRVDEAIRLIQRALQIEPGNAAYMDSLGWAYFRKGNLGEAETNLSQAIAKMPTNAEVLDHVGDLRAKQSRWQEAVDAWTKALTGDGGGIDKEEIQKKIANAKSKLR